MQTKKIFDIIPPSEAKTENIPFIKEEYVKKSAGGLKSKKRIFGLLLGTPVILFLLAYFLIEPRAELLISPKTEMKEFQVQVAVDGSLGGVDLSKSSIPGKIITAEESVSQDFSSSGKILKEVKAGGTIKIYNAYSQSSQTLVEKTRFISADGKLFILAKKTIVPGEYYDKGKLVPGTVDAEVIASASGEEYNIDPTIFSIPGFAGTPKYTSFYAKSFSAMTGGFKKEVAQVSQADLNNAEKVLEEKALQQSLNSLNNKVAKDQDIILPKELVNNNLVDVAALTMAGQELAVFPFQARAHAEGLSFKKSDLSSFAKKYVANQISASSKLQEESLKVNYTVNNKGYSGNKATLGLDIQVRVYPAVEEDVIRNESLGKDDVQAISQITEADSGISEVQVKLWPFWVKTVPLKAENVKITVVLPPVGQ